MTANRFYSFYINIGDFPSSVEAYASDSSVITNVTYTNLSASAGRYNLTFSNPWSADYQVFLTCRSLRATSSTADNKMTMPVVYFYTLTSFSIFIEEEDPFPI